MSLVPQAKHDKFGDPQWYFGGPRCNSTSERILLLDMMNFYCSVHQIEKIENTYMNGSHFISFIFPFDRFIHLSVSGKSKRRWKPLIFSQGASGDLWCSFSGQISTLLKVKRNLLLFIWLLIQSLNYLQVKNRISFYFVE